MKTRRALAPLIALVLAAVAFGVAPRADEGFWPYNSIPRAAIKAKYGFQVTDAWLRHLQLATVRFGGGTGSLISPDGLVLTNHHIALSSLQRLSTPDKDLVKNGFYAARLEDEIRVPGMVLNILQSIEDVTDRVNSAAKPGMSPQDAAAARRKAIEAIQAESQQPGMTSQVVSLYAGAVYNLYRYKTYMDVRLVFGVEYQTGFYGGDPDNFTYPRYNLDVGMFRLYENDKPASTPNYLKWSPSGSRENELVFTTGHPGSTQRLNTVAHIEYLRDMALPFSIASAEMREAAIKKWQASSPEAARQATTELFGVQNTLKSQRGRLQGLQDPVLMAKKRATEERLRAELARNPAKQQELGDAWDMIARSIAVAREIDAKRNFITNAAGLNSTLFSQARALVRAAYTAPSGAGQQAGGRGGATPAGRGGGAPAGRGGAAPSQVNLEREKLNLAESLAFMQKYLGSDHEIVKRILGNSTPAARAAELVDGCRLTDPEIRNLLQAGGRAAIDVSTDPMIVLARSLEEEAQAIAKRYEEEVVAVQAAAYPKIGQAVFVVDGTKAYPDATGTLRLSYGTVKGYVENGVRIPPYTVIGGLFERAAQHGHKSPWDLSPSWVAAKGTLNLKTPMNFVTTNDIVGGNSGSPVIDAQGRIVGLIFDGNIHSISGGYWYDEEMNRSVGVHPGFIRTALLDVYAVPHIAGELGLR